MNYIVGGGSIMPAFYLTTNSNRVLDVSLYKKYFDEQKKVQANETSINFFYNGNDASMINDGEDSFFIIGVFVYKNEWGNTALKLFYDDLKKGENLSTLLSKTHGQFCLILNYQKKLYIVTDKAGGIPVYCYKKDDSIDISNIFLPLAKNNKVSLNYHWLAQYLSQGNKSNIANVIYLEKTVVNEIDLLDTGSIYSFNGSCSKEKYYDIESDIELGKYTDSASVISTTKKILSDNTSFLDNERKIFCDITGGFDTRTNLAMILKKRSDIDTGNQIPTEYSYESNTGKFSDLKLSNEIVKKFNLHFYRFDETKFEPEREKYYDVAYDLFSLEEKGWTYPRRLAYYNYIGNTIKDRILVTGLYGTCTLTDLVYPENLTGDTNNIDEFLHQYYSYTDLLDSQFYTKEKYFDNLKIAFDSIFSKIGSHTLSDAGTYIFYLTFFRQKFSRYHGNTNTILPTYSPYIEADFIKFMFQVSARLKRNYVIQRTIISDLNPELGEIDTTHGYPATKITIKNFYRFIRILYKKEANFNYIGPIDRLISKFVGYIINLVKRNKWSRNIALNIYSRIHKNEKYQEFELSEYKKSIATIENNMDNMPIFKIIDRKKFKDYTKNDDWMVYKILHLNRLLIDIKIL
jgi:hypothetical protein